MPSFQRFAGSRFAAALVPALFMFHAQPAHAGVLAPIWTGAYVGFHGGGNWGSIDFKNIGNSDSSAFFGGGHAGFNLGFGALVAGIEADLNYDGSSYGYTTGGTIGSVDVDWNASLRGRVGLPVGPALLYATAGIAWTEKTLVETSGGLSSSASDTFTGVVYGIGAETYVMPNMSLRLEALRYDYSAKSLSLTGAVNAVQDIDPSDTVIRAGVTFHLN